MRRALAILVALGACGDNIKGIELDELEGSRRAAECERLVRCGSFDDQASCVAFFRDDFDPALAASVDVGKLRFDPLAAEACNRALATRSCDATAADMRSDPPECRHVLRGTIVPGANCVADRECTTGRCDAPACTPDACCAGGCEAFAPPAAIDAMCTADVGCVDGAFCGSDLKCHALAAVGAECEEDDHCAVGLACIGATELQKGNCRALPKIGEACPYLRCAEIGARCDGSICVAVGLTGDSCANANECSSFLYCDATSKCANIPGLGEACHGRCAGEAWCDFNGAPVGTCRSPQPNAAPCTSDNQCVTQFCDEQPIFDACAQPALCI